MKNENKAKRYYWIKLKDSFFTSDTIDYLMSQKNGANYVVLYQMLCLKTVNTDGELSRQIGEIVVPFDAEKIQRDCKFFDIDTIRIALELYKNLGLIFMEDNGILRIANFGNMVGSETLGAIEKREQRKQLAQKVDNEIDKGIDNVYQEKENRDKILDNRDIDIEKKNIKKNDSYHDSLNVAPEVTIIFDFWNKQQIQVHRQLTNDIGKAIKNSLKKYSINDIENAILHYAQAYHDKKYYFKHQWTLIEFLKQKNGLPDFLDNGSKWVNYDKEMGAKNLRRGYEYGKDYSIYDR